MMHPKRIKIVVQNSSVEQFEKDVNDTLAQLEADQKLVLNINIWGKGNYLQAHIIYGI